MTDFPDFPARNEFGTLIYRGNREKKSEKIAWNEERLETNGQFPEFHIPTKVYPIKKTQDCLEDNCLGKLFWGQLSGDNCHGELLSRHGENETGMLFAVFVVWVGGMQEWIRGVVSMVTF